MLELLSFGLFTFPASALSFATHGYIDAGQLCQLQTYQTVLTGMVGTSLSGLMAPERIMYEEETQSFIYVSELLGA